MAPKKCSARTNNEKRPSQDDEEQPRGPKRVRRNLKELFRDIAEEKRWPMDPDSRIVLDRDPGPWPFAPINRPMRRSQSKIISQLNENYRHVPPEKRWPLVPDSRIVMDQDRGPWPFVPLNRPAGKAAACPRPKPKPIPKLTTKDVMLLMRATK